MILITDTYDIICWIFWVIGLVLLIHELYLNDWDFKELYLGHTIDDEDESEDTRKCV